MSRTNRFFQTIMILALLGLTLFGGKRKLAAESVPQESWQLLTAAETAEGIAVETVGKNRMLEPGVKVRADSEEGAAFSAALVRDGEREEQSLRWSSENDWENNEHWLEVSFREPTTVGLVRIYWERANAGAYALEYAEDGKSWKQAAVFDRPPETLVQDIRLAQPVETKYLRLHVTAVTKQEEDLSLYYQNVSVLELEVYEGIRDSFVISRPEIPAGTQRCLEMPQTPEGYSLTFVGANYDTLADDKGRIADTLGDAEAELGFALEKDGVSRELPGMKVTIPASLPAEDTGGRQLPEGFLAAQWRPRGEEIEATGRLQILLTKGQAEELGASAELFAEELSALSGYQTQIAAEEENADVRKASDTFSIKLELVKEDSQWVDPLGEEGYEIAIGEEGKISAKTVQGLRWGCVSFLSLLEKTEGRLPAGVIRDYPGYSVRGFGIDVGRRPVSLALLYRMAEEMSAQKMNTLQVHLNDNQIISQSSYDKTVEGARNLYAGFRLESDLKNEDGRFVTSCDLYYTKAEFAKFIADAAVYGVEVVPEIDTPAHSLALTKVFPELGLQKDPESVDQLDLSKKAAVELGKTLWKEYLTAESGRPVFGECSAVHIGMDEYFGKQKEYLSYLKELSAYVKQLAPEKEIRIWGSLSKTEEDYTDVSRSLQMHIWDTDWADPAEMYAEGFSLINSLSSSLYIIPGGGYDWLDQDFLQEKWQPNIFETAERTWELPAYSPRMLGACYMMWNDWSQVNGADITEEDLFERFARPLPVIAEKLW